MANKASGGSDKSGRAGRKPTAKAYKANNILRKNKLRRIRRSNGEEAAIAYMKGNGNFPSTKTFESNKNDYVYPYGLPAKKVRELKARNRGTHVA